MMIAIKKWLVTAWRALTAKPEKKEFLPETDIAKLNRLAHDFHIAVVEEFRARDLLPMSKGKDAKVHMDAVMDTLTATGIKEKALHIYAAEKAVYAATCIHPGRAVQCVPQEVARPDVAKLFNLYGLTAMGSLALEAAQNPPERNGRGAYATQLPSWHTLTRLSS